MGEDGKPLPYLDEVDFPVIPDDNTRILKLQAGEVDGAELIPYARVHELQGDANLNMALFPSTKVQLITMNVRPKLTDGSVNPLADPKVRQALNYAVDKPALIKIVTFDVGKPLVSFMSSATPLVYDNGPAYPYDPAKAKDLLKQAGIARRHGNPRIRAGRQCRRDCDLLHPAADVGRGRDQVGDRPGG